MIKASTSTASCVVLFLGPLIRLPVSCRTVKNVHPNCPSEDSLDLPKLNHCRAILAGCVVAIGCGAKTWSALIFEQHHL